MTASQGVQSEKIYSKLDLSNLKKDYPDISSSDLESYLKIEITDMILRRIKFYYVDKEKFQIMRY